MISIDVPTNSSYVRQPITLAGIPYELVYKYNSRSKRLSLTLLQDDIIIRSGLYIMENESLLVDYNLPGFDHGEIQNIRFKPVNTEPATLGTIGIDKTYELIYISNEEIEEIVNAG